MKCTLTREESFRLHPKRHAIKMHVKVGCDAEGRITAVRARDDRRQGRVCFGRRESAGARRRPRLRAVSRAGDRHRIAGRLHEQSALRRDARLRRQSIRVRHRRLLNRLADKVGIDGWEIRWRNILHQGDRFATGQKLDKPFGLKETLLAVKDIYRSAKYAGIACGIKNVGIGNGMPDPGKALLRVEPDGKVSIRTGYTEMGQGLFTVTIQTAVRRNRPAAGDVYRARPTPTVDLDCGQTTGSRGTVLSCNAVIDAAKKLKADLDSGKKLKDLIGKEYRGEWICDYTAQARRARRRAQNAPDLRLRHAGRDPRRRRQHQESRRRPRRRQGDESQRCCKARWKARSTWAWATR